MAGKIYGLDLGTYEIKVFDKRNDRIWREKDAIAMKNKKYIFAVGNEAYDIFEKAPTDIRVVFPMKNGVIAHFDDMQYLLGNLLGTERRSVFGAEYVVAVPTDVTEVEKKAFYDLVFHSEAKAKSVRIVEKGLADAVGFGMDVIGEKGIFVANFGGGTTELFGHYPEIYTEKNIPIFASYSFDRCEDGIVTSFGADSLLYVRDTTGRPMYTFGYSARGMRHDYPETNTIDSYMENYQGYREKYSYYMDIKSVGEYLFRSYKLDGEDRYGLQIYKGHDLIGEVATGDPLTVLGEYGGYWYASIPADIENDLLRIVKFRL